MDSVEDYARQWAKREKEGLDTLSEWVKSVRSLIQIRIKKPYLIKELGIDNLVGNPTYTRRHLRKRKSWTIIDLFYIPLECQPKIKNWIYHHSTGFLNYTCSTKPLSKLLTCILSAVITGLQSYCDTSYFRGGVNQMWILKNSTQLFLTLS